MMSITGLKLRPLAFASAAALCVAATASVVAGPFDSWGTSAVLLTQVPNQRSADDVIINPFNNDEVFVIFAGGSSGDNQGTQKLTLTRSGNDITGATLNWTSTFPSGLGTKSLDIIDNDTIYYTVEEGGADTDGTIRSLTGLAGVPTSTDRVDLTAVRNGANQYDPEGIAINRSNNTLYVTTDDGPAGDLMAYNINTVTKALTPKWASAHTFAPGTSNGNDGIVLSDGRVAVIAGSTTANIYAVTDNGASGSSVNLLGGSIAMPTTIQDLLEYNGYLYVLDEEGMLFAYDASNLSSMTNVAAGSINLDTIIGDDTYYGGLDVTADGWLLVSTRGGAGIGDSRVFAIHAPLAVPEPASLVLVGLATLGMIGSARRRGR